jgi:imidazolonepropionase-like amidohydrolase
MCAATFAPAQEQPIVLQTSALLDGKGRILRNTSIVVEGDKITRLDPEAQGEMYDLRGLTVLPGWIDAHVHITYHFGPNGRAYDPKETQEQATLGAVGNAWATLMAGFTTVQSVGAQQDKDLRDFIARAVFPGPRILTSLEPLAGQGEKTGTPEQIRDFVKRQAAQGANLIKIFASKSIREGGGQTMPQEQLEAACGEAKSLGLRTLVHAYGPAIRAAILAGCTQIEHGTFATDDDLRLMAEHGTYFDPQVRLVIQNYLDNKARYLGIGNYTQEGFAAMEKAIPLDIDLFKRAIATRHLKVLFGTDAVAGADGHNAEEFIYRVRDCGQDAMAAMVSANSLASESMGLQDKIGAIAPGMQADIIALDGNPLEDITAVRRVVFVMKGGKIYKNWVVPRHRSE